MTRNSRTTSGRRGSKAAGFTYLALMISVAIISIVSAAAAALGSIAQRRSAEEELLFVGMQFRAALKSYYEMTPAGGNPYPISLQALLKDPRYPNVVRHLRKVYVDPITGRADWLLLTAPGGEIMGISSRSTRHPIKIAQFSEPFETFVDKKSYTDWVFYYRMSPIVAPSGASAVSLQQ